MSQLEYGSVVWVRLGQAWWPGTITTLEKCPPEFVAEIRKPPVAVVKFFHENEFQDVHKEEHIYPYSFERKEEFIKRGQHVNKNQSHGDVNLLRKFESDVVTAEKLTGGDMNILQTIGEVSGKRRIDYSDLGFGMPKAKKKKDESSKRGTDIGQAVVYKKSGMRNGGNGKVQRVIIEHKVKILEQPKRETIEDGANAANWFKCCVCGFTCTRLNVMVWHNKAHLKKVYDFDTGIKIPGRRRKKMGLSKASKDAKKKGKPSKGKSTVDHSHTNGEVSVAPKEGNNTQQLLQDWDDEEEEAAAAVGSSSTTNGNVPPAGTENDHSDDGYSDDDDYPPPQPNHERRPMPKPADINSAFDALLATTPLLNTSSNNQMTRYVSNDSDSETSDWEKYYDKGSDSDAEEVVQESDIKNICEDGFEKSNGVKTEKEPEEEANAASGSNTVKKEEGLWDTENTEPDLLKDFHEGSPTSPKIEEEMSSKSTFSDSAESRSASYEDFDKKSVMQEAEKPSEAISKKSSTDIYEYVDEFGESPQEPYEPPKKPYESLQKYRLHKSPQDSSRTLNEDHHSRDSYTMGKEDSTEDRESLNLYDSCSEDESTNEREDLRKAKSPMTIESHKSPEELPDYESEEENPADYYKSPDYNSDDKEVAEEGRVDMQSSESIQETYESGMEQGNQDVYTLHSYNEPVGEVYDVETSPVAEDSVWEEHQMDHTDVGKGRTLYQSKSSEDGEMLEEKDDQHVELRVDQGRTPQDTHDVHRNEEDLRLKSSQVYESVDIVSSREKEVYYEYQEESCESNSSYKRYSSQEKYRSVDVQQEGYGSPYQEYGVQRIDAEREELKEDPVIRCPSPYSKSPIPLEEHVAESPEAIEDFMKDTDKLTRSIDKLAENLDAKPDQSTVIEESVHESLEEYHEDQVGDTEDMPQVLNLSTQDRDTVQDSGATNLERSTEEVLHSRSGYSSERVYHSRSTDHPISSTSGTSYMLVAVDAHGNTVPTASTSSMNEGNGNLMAVEATLGDGATRTLYIDPTQLGPDVDLNNLMLHIDTSGQEHVILPSSSSSSSTEIIGQEVCAYEVQGQRLTDVSGESPGHRRSISDASHRSDGGGYHHISYSGNYDERYSSGRSEDDHS